MLTSYFRTKQNPKYAGSTDADIWRLEKAARESARHPGSQQDQLRPKFGTSFAHAPQSHEGGLKRRNSAERGLSADRQAS